MSVAESHAFLGTRVAVYDVLDYRAAGMTTTEIVADFPELGEIHVRAALESRGAP